MPISSDMYRTRRGAADLVGGFQKGLSIGQMFKQKQRQDKKFEERQSIKDIFR
ncbi:unnamed protein product, partial [marine sediment metagenome]